VCVGVSVGCVLCVSVCCMRVKVRQGQGEWVKARGWVCVCVCVCVCVLCMRVVCNGVGSWVTTFLVAALLNTFALAATVSVRLAICSCDIHIRSRLVRLEAMQTKHRIPS
jgi:hypothetical protein